MDRSAEEFRLVADLAPTPMWVTGLDRRRTFVNQAYVAFVGVPYDEALAYDWREILHPDDVASVIAQSNAGEGRLEPFTLEGRYRRADGAWRLIRSVSHPRFDAEGRHLGFIGVAHDVTDELARADMRRGEQQLAAFVSQSNAGFAQVDLDGRFTLVNDRFCAITGYPREALIGRPMQAITHPNDLPANLVKFEAAVREGTSFTFEKRYIRPDGSIVWVTNSAAVVRAPSGEPYGVLAVTFDVTERRLADEALRANERRLAFLDALGRATATAMDADVILEITTRLLGEHLGLSDCAYADMEPDEDTFHIRGDWHAPDAPSIVGTYSLAAFGSLAVANLHAGEPLIVHDHVAELGEDGAAAFLAIGIRATICMPLLKEGRLTALMAIHAATPRRWADDELRLLREVAERSWAHIERVRSAAALRDSENRLRLAVEGARIGTWDWDLATTRGSWSARTAEIMGIPAAADVTADQRFRLVHPDDRDAMRALVRQTIAEGGTFAAEYRVLRPDGAVRWVSSRGVVMRDADGTARRMTGTIRDVTSRRAAQEALSALNRTLEQQVADRTAERDRMWRLSRDLFIVVDRRRHVRAVNPAVARLGYAEGDLVGHRIEAFIHPDDLAAATAALRQAMRAPLEEFYARIRASDGSWRRFSWSAAPGDGEAYAIGRDVTAEVQRREELDRAREALRQAQKVESLGQLTGGVAHDFNNLLTPIIGSLDLLLRTAADDRDRRRIGAALDSAERARTLVQRLLAFARRQPLRIGPVDVAALAKGMVDLIASTSGPQIRVAFNLPDGLPPALGDANQLEMALLNLSVNARDAMPDGGALTIAARAVPMDEGNALGLAAGGYVALAVSDTGHGMSEAILAKAIEPFFSTKGIGKGTGLGLSMVHGLASQLGGAMTLASREGLGTTVEIVLPVAAAGVSRAEEPAAPATAPGAGLVLVVDDDEAVRAVTVSMLEDLGLRTIEAASGRAALAMLAAQPVDLLVTDHLMPEMTGVALIERARAERPGLPSLIVSGYADLDTIPPDLPRLAKPFRRAELQTAVAALMA